jgi:predicted ArsR family transcriptional regulator
MEQRTQQLVTLLGRALTRDVLVTLRRAPATEKDLGVALGASQPVLNRCLNDLAAFGLVTRAHPVRTGGRGRPRSAWRIASTQRLRTLERDLDRSVARLP